MTPHDIDDCHRLSDLKCSLKSSLVHPQVLGSASTSRNSNSWPENWRKICNKLPLLIKTMVGTNLSPDLGPMGRGARPPTGPTPRPSSPGRRVSRGPSTCSEEESLVSYYISGNQEPAPADQKAHHQPAGKVPQEEAQGVQHPVQAPQWILRNAAWPTYDVWFENNKYANPKRGP